MHKPFLFALAAALMIIPFGIEGPSPSYVEASLAQYAVFFFKELFDEQKPDSSRYKSDLISPKVHTIGSTFKDTIQMPLTTISVLVSLNFGQTADFKWSAIAITILLGFYLISETMHRFEQWKKIFTIKPIKLAPARIAINSLPLAIFLYMTVYDKTLSSISNLITSIFLIIASLLVTDRLIIDFGMLSMSVYSWYMFATSSGTEYWMFLSIAIVMLLGAFTPWEDEPKDYAKKTLENIKIFLEKPIVWKQLLQIKSILALIVILFTINTTLVSTSIPIPQDVVVANQYVSGNQTFFTTFMQVTQTSQFLQNFVYYRSEYFWLRRLLLSIPSGSLTLTNSSQITVMGSSLLLFSYCIYVLSVIVALIVTTESEINHLARSSFGFKLFGSSLFWAMLTGLGIVMVTLSNTTNLTANLSTTYILILSLVSIDVVSSIFLYCYQTVVEKRSEKGPAAYRVLTIPSKWLPVDFVLGLLVVICLIIASSSGEFFTNLSLTTGNPSLFARDSSDWHYWNFSNIIQQQVSNSQFSTTEAAYLLNNIPCYNSTNSTICLRTLFQGNSTTQLNSLILSSKTNESSQMLLSGPTNSDFGDLSYIDVLLDYYNTDSIGFDITTVSSTKLIITSWIIVVASCMLRIITAYFSAIRVIEKSFHLMVVVFIFAQIVDISFLLTVLPGRTVYSFNYDKSGTFYILSLCVFSILELKMYFTRATEDIELQEEDIEYYEFRPQFSDDDEDDMESVSKRVWAAVKRERHMMFDSLISQGAITEEDNKIIVMTIVDLPRSKFFSTVDFIKTTKCLQMASLIESGYYPSLVKQEELLKSEQANSGVFIEMNKTNSTAYTNASSMNLLVNSNGETLESKMNKK